jgi:hypothetical protein
VQRVPDDGITFIRYAHSQMIGKPNNLKVFGNKYSKGPKHDSQNISLCSEVRGYDYGV